MYSLHMATKTVSLKAEAYERLRNARRYPGESFSEVILRARWPEDTVTGAELLERCREEGGHFTDTELDAMDAMKAAEAPPEDKWTTR
jgi:predicted CopG family antitoxin